MTVADIFLLSLATWSVANIVVNEDGPYEVFPKVRHVVGVRYDEHSNPVMPANPHRRFLASILTCTYCLGVWVAIFFTLLYLLTPIFAIYLALPFAISAIATVWTRVVR